MPGSIRELPMAEGFEVSTKSASFDSEFFVWDTTNIIEVEALVYAAAPIVLAGLTRGKLRAREVGPGMWMCSVTYQTVDPQDAIGREPPPSQTPTVNQLLGPQFAFDTVGGTEHITQSRRTRSMSTISGTSKTLENGQPDPAAQTAGLIDNSKAIGISADRVEGCDIASKKFEWTWDQPLPEVPLSYLITLFHLTGTVNYAAPFFGFDKGEVLYLGASGRFSQNDRWNISHRFSAKPNRTNVSVGGPTSQNSGGGTTGITIPFIAGWDYVWFEYKKKPVGNRMIQVPSTAYVEVVYPSGDMGLIFGGPRSVNNRLPSGVKLKNLSKEIQQIVGTPVPPFDGDPDF